MSNVFQRRPDAELFREMVERDLQNRGTLAEKDYLRRPENLARWAKMLARIKREVCDHIARERAALKSLAPSSGTHASDEYLTLKRQTDETTARRVNFIRFVELRRGEVADLLGTEGLTPVTCGIVATRLIDVYEAFNAGDNETGFSKLRALTTEMRNYESSARLPEETP